MNYPVSPCATCPFLTNHPNCNCIHAITYQQSLQISNLARQVSGSAMLLSQSQAENANLKNRVDVLQRNRKKIMTDARLFCDDHGIMVIAQHYNAGPPDFSYLFDLHQGLGQIITYDVLPIDLPLSHDYITIEIKTCTANCPLRLYARKDKLMSADFCYDLFICHHIIFNPVVKITVLKKALKNFLIQSTNNTFAPKMLSGWLPSSWKFFSAENCYLADSFTAIQAPVLGKAFHYVEPTKERFEAYFTELRTQFPEPEARLLVALLPMMGLTASLLAEYDKAINFVTSFIPICETSPKIFSSWLQIYNRTTVDIIDGTLIKSKLEKEFSSRCDDVLILDGMDYPGQSAYDKKKKAENASFIINRVASGLPISRISTNYVAAALLSSSFVDGDCLQMPIAITFDATVHQHFLKTKSIETVLTGVIKFIQSHQDEAKEILRHQYDSHNYRNNCIKTILQIVSRFFDAEGYSFLDELEIPQGFDVSVWFNTESENNDAIQESFRKILRAMSPELTACSIDNATTFNGSFVYYDDEWIYFPCIFLQEKFAKKSLNRLFQRALLALKNDGTLFTGTGGSNYHKKVIAFERHSFYTIRRSFFTQPGEADILDLMKEADSNAY